MSPGWVPNLEVDLADAQDNDCTDVLSAFLELEADKNDGISCERGIQYQTLHHAI
jgi:hypothetical protein